MLFLLNQKKVPSTAVIIRIGSPAAPPAAIAALAEAGAAPAASAAPLKLFVQKSPLELDAEIQAQEKDPPVVVGVTPTCPYGISACWGGAYEALKHMHGVRLVRPVPNAKDSTAYIYLKHDGLPDLDAWPKQFAHVANGTHFFRGVEVTVNGTLEFQGGDTMLMEGGDVRPPILLQPIEAADKVEWDAAKQSPQPLDPDERDAYRRLRAKVSSVGGILDATVTGPLKKVGESFILEVRKFQ
jgi:hypothetical protein